MINRKNTFSRFYSIQLEKLALACIVIFCFQGIATPCEDELGGRSAGINSVETSAQYSVRSSVWLIFEQEYAGEGLQRGTGFFISPNKFITNFHAIAHTSKVTGFTLLQKENSRILKVKRVLAVSALHDLVLLETEESVGDYLRIRKKPLQEEEDLFITGYAGVNLVDVRKTSDTIFLDDSVILPVDYTSALFGLSGSPVVDANKRVIGVLHGGLGNFIFTVRLDHLKEFVGSGLRNQPTRKRKLGQILRATINSLKNLAKAGNVKAQYTLGRLHMPQNEGAEGFQSYEKAFAYYKQSADQGHAISQHMVGAMSYNGKGVAQNYEQAVEYYTKSAKQGYAPAQKNLAQMYFDGEGVPQSYEESLYWLRKAAEQGFVTAQEALDRIPRQIVDSFPSRKE